MDALNATVATGRIPHVPQTILGPRGKPVYPEGVDHLSRDIGSSTYSSHGPGSIWDGPQGTFGISFDDGPLEVRTELSTFDNAHSQLALAYKQTG